MSKPTDSIEVSETVEVEVHGRTITVEKLSDGTYRKPEYLRDAEREVVGDKLDQPGYHTNPGGGNKYGDGDGLHGHREDARERAAQVTAPATDEAERWDGYGTALAPAHEPVILAMKPKDGTFAENALRHGVAGLNIDGARVEHDEPKKQTSRDQHDRERTTSGGPTSGGEGLASPSQKGRWPANVLLDEAAAELVDQQSGVRSSGSKSTRNGEATKGDRYKDDGSSNFAAKPGARRSDTGGASRFFYTAKASKSDRNAGLPPGEENTHPTVKPTDLIGWLLRLVEMPERNLVLDPFCGSGTTLYVAQQMGLPAIGIDQDEEACELAAKRLSEPSLFS
jgi:hypothetical protein